MGIVILTVVTLVGASYLLIQIRLRQNKEDKASLPMPDRSGKIVSDMYIIYNVEKNDEKGTEGVPYYPCPDGYNCKELFPPKMKFPEDKMVFDNCDGNADACLDIIRGFLVKIGVEDVDKFLEERRL